MTYYDRLKIRHEEVDGETDWFWVKEDYGGWDGPIKDWSESHKDKYLKYLSKRDVVVSAGGNQGLHARFYANLFKNVYVFEPDRLNFHCMVLNAQFDNVFKFNCALGDKPEFLKLEDHHVGNRGMFKVQNIAGDVPILTLDSFGFQTLDLLQLDVEGYEFKVLKGAKATIARCKPIIVAECGTTTAIKDFLESMGYEYKDQSVSDAIYVPIK